MKPIKILLFLTVFFGFTANASSLWLCSVHNTKGQVWKSTGTTRALALSNAMDICSKNSNGEHACLINKCGIQ